MKNWFLIYWRERSICWLTAFHLALPILRQRYRSNTKQFHKTSSPLQETHWICRSPSPSGEGWTLETLKPIQLGQAQETLSNWYVFDPGLCLGKLLSSCCKSGISGAATHGGYTYQTIQIIICVSGICWKQISWKLQNDLGIAYAYLEITKPLQKIMDGCLKLTTSFPLLSSKSAAFQIWYILNILHYLLMNLSVPQGNLRTKNAKL